MPSGSLRLRADAGGGASRSGSNESGARMAVAYLSPP